MKKFRTLILPLFLLAVILFAGYFSPTLFSVISPDFKNEVEHVEIANAASPLYLENRDRLILPPWDRFDTWNAVDFRENRPELIHIDFLADFNIRVNQWITSLNPDAKPAANVLYSGLIDHLQLCESLYSVSQDYMTTYVFLQDYQYTAVDGHIYILDMVVDHNGWVPLYLHIQRADSSPGPVPNADLLQQNFRRMLSTLQGLDPYWLQANTEGIDEEIIRNITASMLLSLTDTRYVHQLLQGLSALLIQPDVFEKPAIAMTYASSAVLDTLFNYQDIYTTTYDNETLLVLSDDQNRTYCLFYDTNSNQVTGYSLNVTPDSWKISSADLDAAP